MVVNNGNFNFFINGTAASADKVDELCFPDRPGSVDLKQVLTALSRKTASGIRR